MDTHVYAISALQQVKFYFLSLNQLCNLIDLQAFYMVLKRSFSTPFLCVEKDIFQKRYLLL